MLTRKCLLCLVVVSGKEFRFGFCNWVSLLRYSASWLLVHVDSPARYVHTSVCTFSQLSRIYAKMSIICLYVCTFICIIILKVCVTIVVPVFVYVYSMSLITFHFCIIYYRSSYQMLFCIYYAYYM